MAEKARFYNAGDRIDEKFIYTLPDGHDIHCNAHQRVQIAARGFTDVALELNIGPAIVRLRTDVDIRLRFGRRGVIQVDRNREPDSILPEEPLAATDEDARKKGDALWRAYLRDVVETFEKEIAEARAAGRPSRTPSGFTRRAYELLNIEVPGNEKFREQSATDKTVEKLMAEVEELKRRVSVAPEATAPLLQAGGEGGKKR